MQSTVIVSTKIDRTNNPYTSSITCTYKRSSITLSLASLSAPASKRRRTAVVSPSTAALMRAVEEYCTIKGTNENDA